jgi:ATP-dependent RNA helicase DeaD
MNNDNIIELEPFTISADLLENKIFCFEDLEELKEKLSIGILVCNYKYPSQIQSHVLKSMFNKKDIFIQSPAGTGKTTACLITTLQIIDETLNKPQVLILNESKEMILYSCELIKKLGYYLSEDDFLLAIGGTNKNDNILKMGGMIGLSVMDGSSDDKKENGKVAKIVFGTLGRIGDLVNYNPNLFDSIKLVVVEDCDDIITGYSKDIFDGILSSLANIVKNKYQLCMITSSISDETKSFVNELSPNPLKIFQKTGYIINHSIRQTYMITKNPKEFIGQILSDYVIEHCIIYTGSNEKTKEIKEYLNGFGYEIAEINSHTDKNQIYSIINDGISRCIVATNTLLLNRVNFSKKNLVINLDLPKKNNIETYIHRIANNQLTNKNRLVINILVEESDLEILKTIEKTFQFKIIKFKLEDFEFII